MKKIQPLLLDSFQVFTEIVAAKRGGCNQRLQAISGLVRERYKEYESCKLELSSVATSNLISPHKNDLESCYTGSTKPLDRLLADINNSHKRCAGTKCQFCGINNISTYDHYLPKSLFPEFSVHALNLIPCCTICNSKKGIAFLTSCNERKIINLYFDELPSTQYLYASIDYVNDIPVATFQLNRNRSISEKQFRLINSHYENLELLKRFRENSAEVFSETRSSIINHAGSVSETTVKEWLEIEAGSLTKRYSVNHWRVALHMAMANDSRFVQSCLVI